MSNNKYNTAGALELGLSVAWGLAGWWLPKYLLYHWVMPSLVDRDTSAVFQVVRQEVVLDFALNQQLVDPPTISSNFLIVTAVWLPLIVTTLVLLRLPGSTTTGTQDRSATSLRTLFCFFATAIGTSEGLTQMFKIYVQRRRPNFIQLCGWEGGRCTNSDAHIVEAQLSFPSGHSSLTACGMTFLTLAVVNAVLTTSTLSRPAKRWTCATVALVALTYTLFVGTSRIVDHWHFPSDVLAGWWLGHWSALGVFHVWYPPLWHPQAGIPWSVQAGGSSAPSSGSLLLLPRTNTKEESFQE